MSWQPLLVEIGPPLLPTLALPCFCALAPADYGIWILTKRMNMHTIPAFRFHTGCSRLSSTMPTKIWEPRPSTTTPPILRPSTQHLPHRNAASTCPQRGSGSP